MEHFFILKIKHWDDLTFEDIKELTVVKQIEEIVLFALGIRSLINKNYNICIYIYQNLEEFKLLFFYLMKLNNYIKLTEEEELKAFKYIGIFNKKLKCNNIDKLSNLYSKNAELSITTFKMKILKIIAFVNPNHTVFLKIRNDMPYLFEYINEWSKNNSILLLTNLSFITQIDIYKMIENPIFLNKNFVNNFTEWILKHKLDNDLKFINIVKTLSLKLQCYYLGLTWKKSENNNAENLKNKLTKIYEKIDFLGYDLVIKEKISNKLKLSFTDTSIADLDSLDNYFPYDLFQLNKQNNNKYFVILRSDIESISSLGINPWNRVKIEKDEKDLMFDYLKKSSSIQVLTVKKHYELVLLNC